MASGPVLGTPTLRRWNLPQTASFALAGATGIIETEGLNISNFPTSLSETLWLFLNVTVHPVTADFLPDEIHQAPVLSSLSKALSTEYRGDFSASNGPA